ncbi:Dipeptidyl aminopeptidase/acylaminoacyl peptidase [Sphingobium sp. AP50]|uniref:Atxe2 family lasso peptide isopeptidase n=1 Tax=Sphingobium sp. AP50 TaxID=1884369 RepID=UPI0008C904BF|nr:Atxe2 family lasso peptide isopeptidase [Sphingobium sp. AP50]SEJ92094.1 Dipeptidyl aminopeptidase/acylaminoacyl peptidase [Sphingobium sp. AP50]
MILASLVALAAMPPIFDPACAGRSSASLPTHGRHITTRDLAQLRDIGIASPYQDSVALDISPDGRRVAFQMRESSPDANRYCLSIVVASLDGKSAPIVVDRGGDLIRQSGPQLGLGPYPSGVPEVIRSVWSPDGRHVAFLKKGEGENQVRVWIAASNGLGSFPLDHGTGDAVEFHWSEDSKHISILSRQLDDMIAGRNREALSGFHMDGRLIPVSSAKPYFKAPFPLRTDVMSLPAGPTPSSQTRFSAIAGWHELPIADPAHSHNITELLPKNLLTRACLAEACTGLIIKAWQSADGRSLSFLRRVGPADDAMALYHWEVASGQPRQSYRTSGVLLGCQSAGPRLVCAQELATKPRSIVTLDPKTGRITSVFDPNPEFESFALSTPKRLYWRNDKGILTFGELVLPPDHKPNEKHPLIVVGYRTRGFLRGGVGDEYPIYALAARGYAVLSFDNPPDISSFAGTKSSAEAKRLDRKDWANRKSILSSIENGVRMVEALGVSDPSRRAITGLSDGSSSLFFALINDHFFHTAIASTCCEEPISSMALIGEVGASYFEENGYPLLSQDDTVFWRAMSVTRNAARIDVPLLLNLAEDEYLYALESIRALRFHQKSVDAYLYPNEFHVKWQPAHRLAIYDRNIAWFDFWLRGIDPTDEDQRLRWTALRTSDGKKTAGSQ